MAQRRPPLSRERVLQAALDLVDREGVGALSMRRLGRELGVEAMSLYGYVDSKDDLIEGVVEQVFRKMPLVGPGPGTWQERLRRHVAAYRDVLLAHPHVVRLVERRPFDTEGTAAFVDSALAELRSTGLDRGQAARVLGVIASFTLGHVAERVGAEMRARDPSRPARRNVDPERFPHLAALADVTTTADYEAEFALAVEFIIGGIERMLAGARDAGREAVAPGDGETANR